MTGRRSVPFGPSRNRRISAIARRVIAQRRSLRDGRRRPAGWMTTRSLLRADIRTEKEIALEGQYQAKSVQIANKLTAMKSELSSLLKDDGFLHLLHDARISTIPKILAGPNSLDAAVPTQEALLHLVVIKGFIGKLLENPRLSRHIQRSAPRLVADLKSLTTPAAMDQLSSG